MALERPQHLQTVYFRHLEIQKNTYRNGFAGFPSFEESESLFAVTSDIDWIEQFSFCECSFREIHVSRAIFD